MANNKRSVLISGCSDGGMGAELAKEFHKAGLHVYATARDVSKMQSLTSAGIETLALDIASESSIDECMRKIPSLDILINNAGVSLTMPTADVDLAEAKKLFDVNLWGHLAMTQKALPLLLRSKNNPLIVNHTSIGSDMAMPFQLSYNASKAAMAIFSDGLRLELEAFGIKVINLKTGGVLTNITGSVRAKDPKLPENSIYAPARDEVNEALRLDWAAKIGIPPEQWAKEVARDLLKLNPPAVIWRGQSAGMARLGGFFPHGWFDNMLKKLTGLDKIERIIVSSRS